MSKALKYLNEKIKVLEINKEYAGCKECVQKDIDDLKMLRNHIEKLEKIIKTNFDSNEHYVYFIYTDPVMEDEIKEVLEDE